MTEADGSVDARASYISRCHKVLLSSRWPCKWILPSFEPRCFPIHLLNIARVGGIDEDTKAGIKVSSLVLGAD